MTLFAHVNFLCSVNRAEEDGKLLTMSGEEVPVTKGMYILTDQNNNSYPLSETRFKDYYVPVQRVEEKPVRTKRSPFEMEQFAEMYKQSWIGNEDEQYINGTSELSKNKAF